MELSNRQVTRLVRFTLLMIVILVAFVAACLGSAQPVNALFQDTLTPTPIGGGSGKIAYVSMKDGRYKVYLVDADGSNPQLLTKVPADEGNAGLSWSPDGKRIAIASERSGRSLTHIWVIDANGTHAQRLTSSHRDFAPAWSPDGKHIAFMSDRDGKYGIYIMDADGQNQHLLLKTSNYTFTLSWSPDSLNILFVDNYDHDIKIYKVDEKKTSRLGVTGEGPAWSPDGKRIAFLDLWDSTTAGFKLWVVNADGIILHSITLQSRPIAFSQPAWSPDGQYIALAGHPGSGTAGDVAPGIYVITADGQDPHRIADDGINPVWQP